MRRLRRPAAWLVIVTVLVAACATRRVTPIGADGQPFAPEADERALWASAEKEEQALLKKARPYDDPLLEQYLAGVGERLTPDDVRAAGGPGFKFGVIRDPTLNAFALPTGKIYVHTGLLSRLDNEAQLAMILGHEMTHVTHRHALSVQRDAQNKQTLYGVLGATAATGVAATTAPRGRDGGSTAGAAMLGPTAGTIVGLGLQLAAVASINGYGRALERDADDGGMQNLVRAGYDPKEAPKVFELLRSESRDRGSLETFFFGSHPKLTERIETTRELVATRYAQAAANPAAVRDTEDFQVRMRSVVRENAAEDIRAGRFAVAQRQLDRVLAVTPRDPVAHMYYGDLHRLQSQGARDAAQKARSEGLALAAYEQAAALDLTLPEPYRQLGFLYYQQKQNAHARDAFRKYLALKPEAPDAKRIKEYLVELDR
jgi:predicted Zn-dependent protease